jgi:hypothetical protein
MGLKFRKGIIEIEKFQFLLEQIKAEVFGVTFLFQKEIILVEIKRVGLAPLGNRFPII